MRATTIATLLQVAILGTRLPDVSIGPSPGSGAKYQSAQGDPADSSYRAARDLLNRGEYGMAARAFHDVAQRFPASRFQGDFRYYEAVARYRLGSPDQLHI